jgi:hypothetical protein
MSRPAEDEVVPPDEDDEDDVVPPDDDDVVACETCAVWFARAGSWPEAIWT